MVTRPVHQAEGLCGLISQYGGTPVRFPVLEISDPQHPPSAADIKTLLAKTSMVIFISPNAVDYGMKAVATAGGLPSPVKVAAIGQGTARKLAEAGRPADVFPSEKFDSEALLAMQELKSASDQQIVIFRGEGGREHLANTLRERGARVDYIECYRRVQPETDTRELAEKLAADFVDAIVVTSNEGLQNLFDMTDAPYRPSLLKVQLFVVSERSQELAAVLGFIKPAIIVNKASDQGIIESLLQWASS